MASFSKVFDNLKVLFQFFNHTNEKRAASIAVIGLIIWIIKEKKAHTEDINIKGFGKNKKQGHVNSAFFSRLLKLIKIAIPSWKESVIFDLLIETVFLIIRTMLSIYISSVNGDIVKTVVNYDFPGFLKNLSTLLMLSFPASCINSLLEYYNTMIGLKFRKNMTMSLHKMYIKDMIYYQITNIDSRISHPEQRFTSDIDKWSSSLSMLYSNLTKPLLDLILFSYRLSNFLTWKGPVLAIAWYLVAGFVMKIVSPPFGKLKAGEQILEGEFRNSHTDLIHYSEEIGFLNGSNWERNRINGVFNRLMDHLRNIMDKKLFMGTFDSLLVKYGATLSGYSILGIPVFGSNSSNYLERMKNDPSGITRDYIRNSSLLINMSKAIGRLAISYKDIQDVAGYTHLINEVRDVLEELELGKFKRDKVQTSQSLGNLTKGQFMEAKYIKFEDVPVIAPNGDILVEKMNFTINPGMNCIVSGPNGCGKSSSFRILGQLWPLWGGKLYRPKFEKLFYIPQRPYLPSGTLRHQIIYPHLSPQNGYSDESILKLLEEVNLGYLIEREKSLDTVNSWNDVFSGGEKQRIAMARLFYHRPEFAILDECTSAISLEDEHILYTKARDLNITLFTISHRASLFKFHEFYLKFDGEGGYTFKKLTRKQQGFTDNDTSKDESTELTMQVKESKSEDH